MDNSSSYAVVDGRITWCGGRGRWSVVAGDPGPEVWRYRSKSAARRHARDLRSVGNTVKVRAYRRSDVRVSAGGYLEPVR